MTQIWERDRVQPITETQGAWLEDQRLIWKCDDPDCGDYHLDNGVDWETIDKALTRG